MSVLRTSHTHLQQTNHCHDCSLTEKMRSFVARLSNVLSSTTSERSSTASRNPKPAHWLDMFTQEIYCVHCTCVSNRCRANRWKFICGGADGTSQSLPLLMCMEIGGRRCDRDMILSSCHEVFSCSKRYLDTLLLAPGHVVTLLGGTTPKPATGNASQIFHSLKKLSTCLFIACTSIKILSSKSSGKIASR
jgi:hypothetical protein